MTSLEKTPCLNCSKNGEGCSVALKNLTDLFPKLTEIQQGIGEEGIKDKASLIKKFTEVFKILLKKFTSENKIDISERKIQPEELIKKVIENQLSVIPAGALCDEQIQEIINTLFPEEEEKNDLSQESLVA
jgi:hypothetical protein